MKFRPPVAAVLACVLSFASAFSGVADAAAKPRTVRGELVHRIVLKWGVHVQRVYGADVHEWARDMGPIFAKATLGSLSVAANAPTFRAMNDAFLTDSRGRTASGNMIAAMANGSLRRPTKALGEIANDLVFIPVTPCRIVDTRVAGGAIAANSSRNFVGVAVSAGTGFAFQGGSSTDCNVAAIGASAIAVNVTAVTPAGAGYATVYRAGDTRPLAASVNYTAGAIVNNSVVVGIPNPLGITDFTIYTFAQSDYVVDIVGYFSPPQATPFDCTNTTVQSFTISANSTNFFNNPTCPTGYKAVTPYCWTASSGVYSQGSGYNANAVGNATFCAWQNTTASNQTVFGGNICCRVPGR